MAKTKLHYNLNRGGWSVTPPKSKVMPARTVHGTGVTIKQPSGKAFDECLSGSARAVFTWFKCDAVEIDGPSQRPAHAERLYFNPRRGDSFFHVVRDGQKVRVDSLVECWGEADRSMWGVVS